MSVPRDPQDSTYRDSLDPTDRDQLDAGSARHGMTTPLEPAPGAAAAGALATPATPSELAPASPPRTDRTAPPEESGQGVGPKLKVAAVVAGAAALANKVRQEAPKKIREVREKRVAGRCVILTEVGGRPVVIGPYSDEQAARRDLAGGVAGAQQVVELQSRAAYFGSPDSSPRTRPSGTSRSPS